MSEQLWSWILTAVGLSGFFLVGKKVWWSWYINLGCQALWFAYAIATTQYGFIVASILYAVVFTKNAVQWTRVYRYEQELKVSAYNKAFHERSRLSDSK